MLKLIRAKRKSMPQFQGQIFLETVDLGQIFRPNLKKQKCFLNKGIDCDIIWNTNTSCHGTFKQYSCHIRNKIVMWIAMVRYSLTSIGSVLVGGWGGRGENGSVLLVPPPPRLLEPLVENSQKLWEYS